MEEKSASEQIQNRREVYIHLDTGLESQEKGLSPGQILESPLQEQTKINKYIN